MTIMIIMTMNRMNTWTTKSFVFLLQQTKKELKNTNFVSEVYLLTIGITERSVNYTALNLQQVHAYLQPHPVFTGFRLR